MTGGPARDGVPGLPVLIAGGGIGGLVLALMLHARGTPCMVLEATTEVRPPGVGINVLLHSIRELARLGLLPRLSINAGNCNHRAYIPKLVEMVRMGRIDPVKVLTKVQPLTSAIEAYEHFDKRGAGWIKTELKLAEAAE